MLHPRGNIGVLKGSLHIFVNELKGRVDDGPHAIRHILRVRHTAAPRGIDWGPDCLEEGQSQINQGMGREWGGIRAGIVREGTVCMGGGGGEQVAGWHARLYALV